MLAATRPTDHPPYHELNFVDESARPRLRAALASQTPLRTQDLGVLRRGPRPIARRQPADEHTGAQQHAALHREQTVLSFPLDGLPDTINQDVKVTITLPRGQRITKLKRLMRAPPLPSTSSALPVQVDHSTRGLRVDGRHYLGVGWYLDGLAGAGDGSGFATFDNL